MFATIRRSAPTTKTMGRRSINVSNDLFASLSRPGHHQTARARVVDRSRGVAICAGKPQDQDRFAADSILTADLAGRHATIAAMVPPSIPETKH
jgi:hypothetical protein